MITREDIRNVHGIVDASIMYQAVRETGDFPGFISQYYDDEDERVVRNMLWILTQAKDEELAPLYTMLDKLIEKSMNHPSSGVRRLSLHIIECLPMKEDDLRTDFLDYCLERMISIEELPGIQSLAMKIAFRMCKFYPELMDEFKRTIKTMDVDYYKPGVLCVRNRILNGKIK